MDTEIYQHLASQYNALLAAKLGIAMLCINKFSYLP